MDDKKLSQRGYARLTVHDRQTKSAVAAGAQYFIYSKISDGKSTLRTGLTLLATVPTPFSNTTTPQHSFHSPLTPAKYASEKYESRAPLLV
jgi:hypothetical protein